MSSKFIGERRRTVLSACAVANFSLSVLCLTPSSAGAAPAPADATAFLGNLKEAEARTAAKDWQAATRRWESVVEANPVEGRFWNALATARYGARSYRQAIAAYDKALELGYGRPADTAYKVACAYALLNEPDQAFTWLQRSLAMGFLDLELLRSDADLASLRSDPRFARLTPVVDSTGLSREEGWRNDLQFLSWQIARIGAAPYRRKPKSWFDAEFEKLAASASRRTDTLIGLELLKIMREIGDGHSGVLGRADADWALTLPIQFYVFEEGVYVIAADPKHRDLLGARVLSYGGKPIEQVMAVIAEGVSRDNDGPWVKLQSSYRLRHTALLHALGATSERDGAVLQVQGLDGKKKTVRVGADTSQPDIWNKKPNPTGWANLAQTLPGPMPLYLRDPAKPYWFEHLAAERTVYVALNSVRDEGPETLASFSGRLAKFIDETSVDKLVVDLRWNNGGNTQLLTPVLAAVLRSEKTSRRGQLFVLIGRRTFSAGQNAATMLERFTNATFIGEPTGSSPNFVGEDSPFTLPYSKLRVNVSNLEWQSGLPRDHRAWIAPLIYVAPSFAAYRDNRDPTLDAVLALPSSY